MATFAEILLKAETELSLMGGLDVQTYGEPKLAAKLQRIFNTVFDKRFWKDHRKFATFTTNGINGVPIGIAAGEINRFMDIEYIWAQDEAKPLVELSGRVNPALVTRHCFASNSASVAKFVVLPLTVAHTYSISYRTRPANFVDDTEVPFDVDYLTLELISEYLIDEGANLQAAQNFQKKAADRLQDLLDLETTNDKSMGSYTASHLTEWY